MKSITTVLLTAVLATASNAFAATPNSLVLVITKLPDSCSSTEIETQGDAFVDVNVYPVPFYTIPGTFRFQSCAVWQITPDGRVLCQASNNPNDRAEEQWHGGEFSNGFLRVGQNDFNFGIETSNNSNHCTDNLERVVLKKSAGALTQLFLVHRVGTSYTGRTSIELSLDEINPELGRFLSQLKARIASHIRQIEANEFTTAEKQAHQRNIERMRALETALDELLSRRLADITNADIDALWATYSDVLPAEIAAHLKDFLINLQKEAQVLREEVRRAVGDTRTVLDQSAEDIARRLGETVDPAALDPKINPDDVEIPSPTEEPEEPEEDPYGPHADEVIAALLATTEGEHVVRRAEFLQIYAGWVNYSRNVAAILETGASALASEIAFFESARQRVDHVVFTYLDQELYFKDAPVPPWAKGIVRDRITPLSPDRAARLQYALNTWKSEDSGNSQEQLVVLESLDVLGGGYAAIQSGYGGSETLAELNRILDVTTAAALTVADVGLSLIPFVGDFKDFCEATSGRRFCVPGGEELSTWERAGSALGLIAGSRLFWSSIVDFVSGSFRVVASVASEIAEWIWATVHHRAAALIETIASPTIFLHLKDVPAVEIERVVGEHGSAAIKNLAEEMSGSEIVAALKAKGLGRLKYIGPDTWESTAGLIYGTDRNFGNRVKHVLAHTVPDTVNPGTHTVFTATKDEVLAVVDQAWLARGAPVPNDPAAYIVPMGRVVGTDGETAVRIIVRPGTSRIVTAYPVKP